MIGITRKLLTENGGATSIEYALIASLVCIAIVSATSNVGQELAAVFDVVAEEYRKVN